MFEGLWFFVKFGWKSDRRYILFNFFGQLLTSLTPLVAVTMPKLIIDELMGHGRVHMLALYVTILAGLYLLTGIGSNFFAMHSFTLRCKVAADFGLMMHKKLADADFENLEDPSFLDLKKKADRFLYGDWHGFSYVLDSAMGILGKLFTLAGAVAILSGLDAWTVLLVAIFAFPSAAVEAWAKKSEQKLAVEQIRVERRWQYFGSLFESFKYGKEIRIHSLGDWLLSHEGAYMNKVMEYYRRRNGFYIRSGTFSALLQTFLHVLAYAYLIGRVLAGAITIGDFTMYIGAVLALSGAMKGMLTDGVEIKAYGIYYGAMRDYINIPSRLRTGKSEISPGGHRIEFKDVSFRYVGQNDYALYGINIVIAPGEKLAVVGENGAGKTTFVKLLTRLYDPSEGEIMLDGVNIRDVDYEKYMSLLSAVFQDYQLFSFSLKENVSLSQASDEGKIKSVLRRVGLGGKIGSLPRGIDTAVYRDFDESGFEPSGGEGQKIALARALYKDTPIVILDEPTAALDPRAEYEMYQHFNELVKNKTAVYISHRLSAARFCDKIAVFQRGRIVEYGTHEELIGQNGAYKELYDMQARYYKESPKDEGGGIR